MHYRYAGMGDLLCRYSIHNAKRVCGLPHPHFAAPCFDISARDDIFFIGFLIHMMEMPGIFPKYFFALLSTTNFIESSLLIECPCFAYVVI
jgi:hypothetical protein